MGKIIVLPARRYGKAFARQTVIGVDPGHPDGDVGVIASVSDGKVRSVQTAPRRGDYLRGIPPARRSIAQRRELALIVAAEAAGDAQAAEWWRAQADRYALGDREPIRPAPVFARTAGRDPLYLPPDTAADPRHRPVSLAPWLILGVLIALAIALTPVVW